MGTDDAGGRLWDRVRSGLGRLRRWPQRVLHPLRRSRARRRLRAGATPGRVLFVCHGNICRSPYAEGVLRARTGGRVEADSAGFQGPDRSPPEAARRVAAERGVDLSGHRSKLVERSLLDAADLVVVMEPGQARSLERSFGLADALLLGDLDPEPVERRTVRDPVMQPPEVFRQVYARIDRCVTGLVAAAGMPSARRQGARPDPDAPTSGADASGTADDAGDRAGTPTNGTERRAGRGIRPNSRMRTSGESP